MTREQFLAEVWRKYPKVSPSQGEFLFGRIVKLENQSAEVKRDDKITTIGWNSIALVENDNFGQSCSLQCLREGDVIAFKKYEGGKGAFFLLSPCLSKGNLNKNKTNLWTPFIRLVEDYFLDKAFHKVRTPFLVPSPGVDHHIDFLKVETSQTKRSWTLPTSPEIHLKKSICQGRDKVFEIKTCFRDDLEGPQHSVEFEMLEWYRCYENLQILIDDLSGLFSKLKSLFPQALQDFDGVIAKTTIREQFKKHMDVELKPETPREQLFQWAQEQGLGPCEDDDWNTLFFRIYIEKIEPHLGKSGLQVVYDFPAQQASLAQISQQGWAERFELYWDGVELANAYCEVNDPVENEKRFAEENKKREESGKQSYLDEEFFAEMKRGMPPAVGIALGLERLFNKMSQH